MQAYRPVPTPPLRAVLLPDLLRAVGSWSWLEGLVPRGLHSGSHGVLWSLELGHLDIGLAVGCGTWGLGGERGSHRLGLPGRATPEGRGWHQTLGFRPQVTVCVRGLFCLQTMATPCDSTPVLRGPSLCGMSPSLQPCRGNDTPVCASPRLVPSMSVCERGLFLVADSRALGW